MPAIAPAAASDAGTAVATASASVGHSGSAVVAAADDKSDYVSFDGSNDLAHGASNVQVGQLVVSIAYLPTRVGVICYIMYQ